MGRDEAFIKWFEKYFCYTQTEDSPYHYNDVKQAFYIGYLKGKEAKDEKKL